MADTRRSTHTVPQSPTQGLVERAASHQESVLLLLRQVRAGKEHSETIHVIRTLCRRLQALLELFDDTRRARAVADCVALLSKLRALQVFRQYLLRSDAGQRDLAVVDERLTQQMRKVDRTEAYRRIEHVVSKEALPDITSPHYSWSRRLDELRHEHRSLLKRLIESASDKPRRKRLHALRLALKTVRYQTEWLPGRTAAKHDLLSQLRRVQTILGKYEELADFHRWRKKLSRPVQRRITMDWKRARKRARRLPGELCWILDALASGDVWTTGGPHVSSVNRKFPGVV